MNVERIAQRLARAAVDVDHVAEMVEREERDADREHEVQDVAAVTAEGTRECVHLTRGEVGVFPHCKRADIDDDRTDQHGLAMSLQERLR